MRAPIASRRDARRTIVNVPSRRNGGERQSRHRDGNAAQVHSEHCEHREIDSPTNVLPASPRKIRAGGKLCIKNPLLAAPSNAEYSARSRRIRRGEENRKRNRRRDRLSLQRVLSVNPVHEVVDVQYADDPNHEEHKDHGLRQCQ